MRQSNIHKPDDHLAAICRDRGLLDSHRKVHLNVLRRFLSFLRRLNFSTMFMCDLILQIHIFCSTAFCKNFLHYATLLRSYSLLTIYYGAFEYHGFEGSALTPGKSMQLCA